MTVGTRDSLRKPLAKGMVALAAIAFAGSAGRQPRLESEASVAAAINIVTAARQYVCPT